MKTIDHPSKTMSKADMKRLEKALGEEKDFHVDTYHISETERGAVYLVEKGNTFWNGLLCCCFPRYVYKVDMASKEDTITITNETFAKGWWNGLCIGSDMTKEEMDKVKFLVEREFKDERTVVLGDE